MRGRTIAPAKPYFPEEDISQIHRDTEAILRSGMLTLGDYTRRFEEEFAKLCHSKFGVAVNSGTSAIEIALRGLGTEEATKF